MKYLIIFLIVSFAAIANSAMDQIKFNPLNSVFFEIKNKAIRLWVLYNGSFEEPWMHPFFMFLSDGWHGAKGIMIGLFIGGISYFAASNLLDGLVIFFGASLIFMLTHMSFFNGVFKE